MVGHEHEHVLGSLDMAHFHHKISHQLSPLYTRAKGRNQENYSKVVLLKL